MCNSIRITNFLSKLDLNRVSSQVLLGLDQPDQDSKMNSNETNNIIYSRSRINI